MIFTQIPLHPNILKAIDEMGHTTPTPIQEKAIPVILNGSDLRASAQTGTGKTAAFVLPALHKLTIPSSKKTRGPRVLILTPTRELAMQVATETAKYSKYLSRAKTVCLYGGIPYAIQNRELSRPYEILVATPGRLIDQIERGRIDLSGVELFILDEADRMLDMGFIEPVQEIAASLPSTRQTLLFSATLKGAVVRLSENLLKNPIEISIAAAHEKHENIDQRIHKVDNINHKYQLLDHFLSDETIYQTIIFTATKHQADTLTDKLLDQGHKVAALHGDMNQRQRTKTLSRLRKEELRILVATDVAARGIDVQTITHVINFDLPMSPEDYVHRIGRTGRAGASGVALSFVAPKDRHLVKRIEQFTGQQLSFHIVQGMEPKMQDAPRKQFASKKRFSGGGGYGKPSTKNRRPGRSR